MNPSAGSALQRAIAHTIWVLFQPPSIVKWLKLGLVVVLLNGLQGNVTQVPGQALEGLVKWYRENPARGEQVLLVGGVIGGGLVLGMLVLGAIAEFVFLDNICGNHARLMEPAKRVWKLGVAWLPVKLGLGVMWLVALGGAMAPFLLAAYRLDWDLTRANMPWIQLLVSAGLTVLALLVMGTVTLIVRDIALPLAYVGGRGVVAGIAEGFGLAFRNKLFYFLYVLIKIGVNMIARTVLAMLGCIVTIPFIAVAFGLIHAWQQHGASAGARWGLIPLTVLAVLLFAYTMNLLVLPVLVFERSFSLAAIEEFRQYRTISRSYDVPGAPQAAVS